MKYEDVEAIGLGARDSLRLEAGLCLYGHDIDKTTSPIEAGLIWSIQKNRREGASYLGAKRVEKEIKKKPARKLVGMGYVSRKFIKAGTPVQLIVRGKARPAKVTKMPFAPHNYYRGN